MTRHFLRRPLVSPARFASTFSPTRCVALAVLALLKLSINGAWADTHPGGGATSHPGPAGASPVEAAVVNVTAPGTPTGFQAGAVYSGGKPFAALSWTANTSGGSPTGFLLERRLAGTSTYQRVAGLGGSTTTFSDQWTQPATDYDYRLSASNSGGVSGYAATTFPATLVLPSGYVPWASALTQSSGSSPGNGGGWADTGLFGYANAFQYAFTGNPVLNNAPGSLFLKANAASPSMQVWGRPFAARTDLHYQLQGSPDFAAWTPYLDETTTAFAAVGKGSGFPTALLSVDPTAASAPRFFRWLVSANITTGAAPAGMLVNGLPGASGATLTQNTPVFSWANGSDTQTAYQVLVATTAALLTESGANVWNSGKIAGSGSLNIPFAGLALQNDTTYYWTVRTWNSAGVVSAFVAPQTFRTGTLGSTYRTDAPLVVQETVAPVQCISKGTGWYFVDFGQDSFGTVRINVPSPIAGQVITVGMGEALTNSTTVNTAPTLYVRYQSQSITMQSGVTSYTVTPAWSPLYSGSIAMPGYLGQVAPFRYAEIKNVPEPFTASQISQLVAHTPFDDAAATFTCSDPLVNAAWNLSKHTAKAATFTGYIVDGDRERIPYEADGYIGMLNLLCMNGDYATPRLNHEYLLTHATWPTEWLSHSIFMAWMDYLYTGDTRSLAANYATLQGKLLSSRVRSDGLYTGTTISGSGSQPTDIVDWPAGERDGYDMAAPVKTVTSAFRYQALVYMQQIATALGYTSDASGYQAAATLTLNSINSKLWDATNKRYFDGMSTAGVADAHSSIHANFFPLAFGIVPAAQQANVVNYLKARGTAASFDMICSPYGAQYLLEAIYSAGEGTYAQSLFDSTSLRSWYNMLSYKDANGVSQPQTMTQEAWDKTLKTNEDWNHVWGAAAGNIIPRWLMGVRPLAPGFQKILIQPQPGTMAYANLTMPTVRGPVTVNVQANTGTDFTLSVNIPANATAKVGLPTLGSTSTTVTVDGVASSGTISGATIFIDNVPPGPHLFERLP